MKKIMALLILLILTLSACERNRILLVTTTSLENSGLLSYLIPHFEAEHNVSICVVAVGSGAAFRLGEQGQADLLIVHDPSREHIFLADGYATQRHPWIVNDFILVGPTNLEHDSLKDLLNTIIKQHQFISRGDDSGTHVKERLLWAQASIDPTQYVAGYQDIGQSMEATLMMASQRGAYTLTDRATFMFMQDELNLTIVHEDPLALRNPYSLLLVNPTLHNRNTETIERFYQWLISEEALTLIENYTIDGTPLFHRHP